MEEEKKEIKPKKRKWLRWLLAIVLLLLFIILILFPPIVSKFILKPALEEGFQQATSNEYEIQFSQLKWSLLGRRIELSNVKIDPVHSSDSSLNFQLKMDMFSMEKIQYIKLLNSILEVGQLKTEGVNLIFNNSLPQNQPHIQETETPLIELIKINEIDLEIDRLLMLDKKDSMMLVKDVNINIEQLSWDQQKEDAPIIEKLTSTVNSLKYREENQVINLNNFKVSENRLRHFSALFESIKIENTKDAQEVYLSWPSIELDSVRRNLVDSIWVFESSLLKINNDSLYFYKKNKSRNKLRPIQEVLKDFAEHQKIKLNLDKLIVNNDVLNLNLPQLKLLSHSISSDVAHINLSKQDFKMGSEFIKLGSSEIYNVKSKDRYRFSQLKLANNDMLGRNFEILPHKKNFSFNTDEIRLKGISWEKLERNKEIVLEELYLNQPVFVVESLTQNPQNELVSPIDLQLNKVFIENGDFSLEKENLKLNNFNLRLDSIYTSKDKLIKADSVFKKLFLESEAFSLGKQQDHFFIQGKDLKLESEKGHVGLSEIQIAQQSDSLKLDIISSDLNIVGVDWKAYVNHQGKILVDSIKSDSLRINGNIKAFISSDSSSSESHKSILVNHLNLPDIEIDFLFENDKRLYFEKIDIQADQLVYSNQLKKPIDFYELDLNSQYSSYSENADSLLFTSQGWSFQSYENKWISENIFIKHLFEEDSLKTNSDLELKIPQVSISGFDPYDYLVDKKISVDSFEVIAPKLKFSGKRFKETRKMKSLNWQQELRQIVERFVHIDFKYIRTKDASFAIKNQFFSRRDEINFEKANLEIHNFYLDYQSLKDWKRFFFSEYFDLEIQNYFHSVNNGQFLFDTRFGKLSSESRSLKLKNINYLSLSDQVQTPLNFKLDEFSINHFYLSSTSNLPDLAIGSIDIRNPEIHIKSKPKTDSKTSSFEVDSIFLYEQFKNYFNAVAVDSLKIDRFSLNLPKLKNHHQFNGINALIQDVRIDSLNHIFTQDKFFYSGNVQIDIPQYSWFSKDRLYRYQFEEISFNSKNKEVEIDSLQIISRYDRKTFSANLQYQKDQTDAVFPSIKIKDIDLRDALLRQRFTAINLDVYHPHIRIYKDKTIKVDTSAYKFMPAQQLQNLGFYINIDTVKVHNGFIQYEEFAGRVAKPGKIFFDDMNLNFTGFSNDKDFRDFGGVLKMVASARMMGKSKVGVTAVFPLSSKSQEFVALASMEQLEAVELNPLIQPITPFSAKSGNLMQMQMNILGNNEYATGEMLLKYENLKVEVFNKKQKESGFATFFANSVIRRNNKNFLFPRKGPIYYDRVKYRSFIHYLSHFAIIGAKTSIGIDKRKIQKKIEEAKESH